MRSKACHDRETCVHELGFWGYPTYTYTVGSNGLSAGETVGFVPDLDWYGYRWNLELYAPDSPAWASLGSPTNNLQTALVVTGLLAPPGGTSRSSQRTDVTDLLGDRRRLEAEAVMIDQINRRR